MKMIGSMLVDAGTRVSRLCFGPGLQLARAARQCSLTRQYVVSVGMGPQLQEQVLTRALTTFKTHNAYAHSMQAAHANLTPPPMHRATHLNSRTSQLLTLNANTARAFRLHRSFYTSSNNPFSQPPAANQKPHATAQGAASHASAGTSASITNPQATTAPTPNSGGASEASGTKDCDHMLQWWSNHRFGATHKVASIVQRHLGLNAAGLLAKTPAQASLAAATAEASKYVQDLQLLRATFSMPALAACADNLRKIVNSVQSTQSSEAVHTSQTDAVRNDAGNSKDVPTPLSFPSGASDTPTNSLPPGMSSSSGSSTSNSGLARYSHVPAEKSVSFFSHSPTKLKQSATTHIPYDIFAPVRIPYNIFAPASPASLASLFPPTPAPLSAPASTPPSQLVSVSLASHAGTPMATDKLNPSASTTAAGPTVTAQVMPLTTRPPLASTSDVTAFAQFLESSRQWKQGEVKSASPTQLVPAAQHMPPPANISAATADRGANPPGASNPSPSGSSSSHDMYAEHDGVTSGRYMELRDYQEGVMSEAKGLRKALFYSGLTSQQSEIQDLLKLAPTTAAAPSSDCHANLSKKCTPPAEQLSSNSQMCAEHDGVTSTRYLQLRDLHGDVVLDVEALRTELLYNELKVKTQAHAAAVASASDNSSQLPSDSNALRSQQPRSFNQMYTEHNGITTGRYLELRDYQDGVMSDLEGLQKEVSYQGLKLNSQMSTAQDLPEPVRTTAAAQPGDWNASPNNSKLARKQVGANKPMHAVHDGITSTRYLQLRDLHGDVLADVESLRQERFYQGLKLQHQGRPSAAASGGSVPLEQPAPRGQMYADHDGVTTDMYLKLRDFQADVTSDVHGLRKELSYQGLKLNSQAAKLGKQGATLEEQASRLEAQELQLGEQQSWLEFQGARLAEQGKVVEEQQAMVEIQRAQLGEQDELLGELQGQLACKLVPPLVLQHVQQDRADAWLKELGLEMVQGVSRVQTSTTEQQQLIGGGAVVSVPNPAPASGSDEVVVRRFSSAQIRRQQQLVLQHWRDRRWAAQEQRWHKEEQQDDKGVQAWLRQRESLLQASQQHEDARRQALREKFSQLPLLGLSWLQRQAASSSASRAPNSANSCSTADQTGIDSYVRRATNQQPPPPSQPPPIQRTPPLPLPFFGWGAGLGKGFARPLIDSSRRAGERILYSPWFSKTADGSDARSVVQDLAAARQSAAARLADSRRYDGQTASDFPLLPAMFTGAVAAMHVGLLGAVGLAAVVCVFVFANAALNRWNYEPSTLPPAPFPSASGLGHLDHEGPDGTESAPVPDIPAGSTADASPSPSAAAKAAAAHTAAATTAAAAAAAAEAADHLATFMAADRRRLSKMVKTAPKGVVAPEEGTVLEKQGGLAVAVPAAQQIQTGAAASLSSHAAGTGAEDGRMQYDADTARLQQVVVDLDAEVARLTSQLNTLQPPPARRNLWPQQWWSRSVKPAQTSGTSSAPVVIRGMTTGAVATATAGADEAERAEAVLFVKAALERAVVFQQALARQVKERASASKSQ